MATSENIPSNPVSSASASESAWTPANIAIPASPPPMAASSSEEYGTDAHSPPAPIRTPTPKAVNPDKEPEDGELRQFGSLYVEDIRKRFYRQIYFQDIKGENQLEVYIYRLGFIDMVSISGTSVPLSDLLNIQYLGYWEKDHISIYLKNEHTVLIPKIPNTMLIEALSYISSYPYDIPQGEEDTNDGSSDLCFFISFVIGVVGIVLWVYYVVMGSSRISAANSILGDRTEL